MGLGDWDFQPHLHVHRGERGLRWTQSPTANDLATCDYIMKPPQKPKGTCQPLFRELPCQPCGTPSSVKTAAPVSKTSRCLSSSAVDLYLLIPLVISR